MESDASGKDQVDVWSEGSDSKPVNVEVGCGESEDEDEELYIFPQCAPTPAPAAAPKGRAAQLPSLTPAASSERRAASPAPLTTADVSGGRATPATVVSVNEGFGPAKFEGLGFPVVQASVVGARIVYSTKMPKRVPCRHERNRGWRSYTSACIGWEGSCEAQVDRKRSNWSRGRSNAWGCPPFASTSWRGSRCPGNGDGGCV